MLQHAGVRVGYERVGVHGTVSSYYAVADTQYQGPHGYQAREDYSFEHTWQLVRQPLKTIASMSDDMYGMGDDWWGWQRRHTGIDQRKLGKLRAACEFVLDWTPRGEAMAPERVFRIEDWKTDWPEIAGRLGIPVEPWPDFSTANSRHPKPPLTYDMLADEVGGEMVESIRKLSNKYGYE